MTHIAETVVRQEVRTADGLKSLVGALLQPLGLEQQFGQLVAQLKGRHLPQPALRFLPSLREAMGGAGQA